MTGLPNDVLGGVIGLVVVAMAIGVVDLVRQPGWAWKAAGEPKLVCLAPGGAAARAWDSPSTSSAPAPRWSPWSPGAGPPPSPSSASPTAG